MLAMTTIGDVSQEIKQQKDVPPSTLPDKSGSASSKSGEMSNCSGLSALIDAATSRLCEVSQQAENSKPSTNDDRPTSSSQKFIPRLPHNGSDLSQSDSASQTSPTATTPTMLPETHNVQEQSFLQVLMTVLTDPENSNIITFLPDGKFFAVRPREFAKDVMRKSFFTDSYPEFLRQLSQWGFSSMENERAGIQIFRHPHFRRDHRDFYARMLSPQPPPQTTTSSSSPKKIPPKKQIQLRQQKENVSSHNGTTPMDCTSPTEAAKRRLSPAHSKSDLSSMSNSSQRLRLVSSDGEQEKKPTTPLSSSDALRVVSCEEVTRRHSDGCRDVALSLNIGSTRQDPVPLVQQGVESATQSIVADAIESLFRDEKHSRETYLKHEEALTKSALPGVEPITKQLFDPARTTTGSNRNSVSSSNDSSTVDSCTRMEHTDTTQGQQRDNQETK